MLSRLPFFSLVNAQVPLHRWCHRTSPAYGATCVWEQKVDAANYDNTLGATLPRPADAKEVPRDALTVFIADAYGM